jgi:hypothetical protein
MGLPVEDDRGARAESDRGEVKGTGGRSYVVRHMSKTGRRLGGSRQAQARTADGQWQGVGVGGDGVVRRPGVRYVVWFAGRVRAGQASAPAKRAKISGPAT